MYPRLSEATLGQVDDSYYFSASCHPCHRSRRLSLLRLRVQLGDDFRLEDIRPRLRCSQCGSRRIIITYLTPNFSTNVSLAPLFLEPAE